MEREKGSGYKGRKRERGSMNVNRFVEITLYYMLIYIEIIGNRETKSFGYKEEAR